MTENNARQVLLSHTFCAWLGKLKEQLWGAHRATWSWEDLPELEPLAIRSSQLCFLICKPPSQVQGALLGEAIVRDTTPDFPQACPQGLGPQ